MTAHQQAEEVSIKEVRRTLAARLREALPRIEEEILQRAGSISRSSASADPEYLAGAREAVQESLECAVSGVEAGEWPIERLPPAVAAQARRAARVGVPLDTVLRRYHAGDRLLSSWILCEGRDLPSVALQEILLAHGRFADDLTAAMASEYMQEAGRNRESPAQRLRERVRRLLAGEADRDPTVGYAFDSWHIGMIAAGQWVDESIRKTGKQLDCQVLLVSGAGDNVTWAWLGGRRRLSVREVETALRGNLAEGASIALGEVRLGLAGWRLTHSEAQAARRVALHRSDQVTRCRDVILESAVMQDPVLATSLVDTFLGPLTGRGDTSSKLRQTLRAYLGADQNVAAAAKQLGVARPTVKRHLRTVEAKVGENLERCFPQLVVALAVEEMVESMGTRVK